MPLASSVTANRRLAFPLLCLIVLAWVNVYICRDMFFTEYTGYSNSMHGVWIAMARLGPPDHWIQPTWWPFWYGGMPYEYTYAPLIPGLTAAFAKVAGCSAARAYHTVSGIFHCLAPVVLFVVAWRMTRSPGYSFAAALAYSLAAPTELLLPDGAFRWTNFWNARRLYLNVVWDEMPHQASISFALLAALFLSLSFRARRRIFYLFAGIFMAAAVLSNAFGGILILLLTFCLAFALETDKIRAHLALALGIGAVAYLVISPWFPPSLVETIRHNAQRFDGGWTIASLTALLAVIVGWLWLWRALHRWTRDWALRFFVLLAYATSCIPLLAAYADRHFIPQPGRYKVEMELALVLLMVFAARPAVQRLDRKVQVALALLLLSLAAEQVIGHRRYAKQIIRGVNISETIEYRAARWVEEHFQGQRVMLPGSIGQWLNAFVETPNFSGGSFPTAPNWTQQVAFTEVYAGESGEASIAWLQAFGVQAVAVTGPNSPEFWKPYAHPRKFEGLLPVLWRQDDVTVYRLPQRSASLAHVVPRSAVVQRGRRDSPDLAGLRDYLAALESPDLPLAETRWDGWNRAIVRAPVQKDQVVSVQMNYHAGWQARANGHAVPIIRDGLGFLCIQPDCDGPCTMELAYDGGWEYKLCYTFSAFTLLGLLATAVIDLRTRRLAQSSTVHETVAKPGPDRNPR
jgi:hypothetical protein